MQEKGKRRASNKPRCPVKIYEKDSDGGWAPLETLDAEKPTANKDSAFTDMKTPLTCWNEAIEAIRFYDESETRDERRKF